MNSRQSTFNSFVIDAAFGTDLIYCTCNDICDSFARKLPDLHDIVVLSPNKFAYASFITQLHLLAQDQFSALLLPCLSTMREFVLEHYFSHQGLMSQQVRELTLYEVLRNHQRLFRNANPWLLTKELLFIFDELTLNSISLPTTQQDFECSLYKGLSIPSDKFAFLTEEATLIHSIWDVWNKIQVESDEADPTYLYSEALLHSSSYLKNKTIYIMGYEYFYKRELDWIHTIATTNSIRLIVHKDIQKKYFNNSEQISIKQVQKVENQYHEAVNTIFSINEASLVQRANKLLTSCPKSVLADKLHILKAVNTDAHVAAIDTQIRLWLHKNIKNIGVVTSDRKLARRLRATLERANININDLGGWALSTTSSGAFIEEWLQLIEQDADYKHLLAILKSPFLGTFDNWINYLEAVTVFERDIIIPNNITHNFNTFRYAVLKYIDKVEESNKQLLTPLLVVLEKIIAASQPIFSYYNKANFGDAATGALLDSLTALGAHAVLLADEAGKQIVDHIQQLRDDLRNTKIKLSWTEWRNILRRTLDSQNFKSTSQHSSVTLCNLDNCVLLKFDALIVASLDETHFPGTPKNRLLFNDRIRHELNLSIWETLKEQKFHQFKNLLTSASEALLTVQLERDGTPVRISPWLDILETCYAVTYNTTLLDKNLSRYAGDDAAKVRCEQLLSFADNQSMPRPIVKSQLLPTTYSSTKYQTLLNCPYQFFIRDCLTIDECDEIKEEMQKSDFGALVHLSLKLFFEQLEKQNIENINTLTVESLSTLATLLQDISKSVFSKYSKNNILHRIWVNQWLDTIPKYLQWELEHQKKYTPFLFEQKINKQLDNNVNFTGRIDRIDKSLSGNLIIDYKTGWVPTVKDLTSGEAVQLPAYKLLIEDAVSGGYLRVMNDSEITLSPLLANQELGDLAIANGERLMRLAHQLRNGAALPAWGDEMTCGHCNIKGVCRKDAWRSYQN